MPLYLLTSRRMVDLDCAAGFVVAAPGEAAARGLAASKRGDEGREHWRSALTTTCTRIAETSTYTEPRIVLRDFNAG